jgi:FixJ family two-component response regulator
VGTDPDQLDIRLAFVLDDEERVGSALCTMLSGIGIKSRQFIDAAEFLRELEPGNPDLIFLDLALGQSDAIEIIHQLEDRRFKGRVMLISGRDMGTLSEVELIGRAHGLSMLPSLPKPFRIDDVRYCLQASPPLQPDQSEVEVGADYQRRPDTGMPLRSKA